MSSLSRLLKLARRSYGPVFVYDSEREEDYVLLSADAYLEEIYTDEDDVLEDWYDFERSHMMRDPEEAFFDDVTQDIDDWNEPDHVSNMSHSPYEFEPTDVPFSSFDDVPPLPVHDDSWHTPASVFESYAPIQVPIDIPPHESYIDHDALRGLRPEAIEPLQWEDDGTWNSQFELPNESTPQYSAPQPVRFEPVPFDPPLDTSRLESEPLPDSDAPVFYEEPVI